MKNLHLMPMNSAFDVGMVSAINDNFPPSENVFVFPTQREALAGISNCIVEPDAFSPLYINDHAHEYKHIILQSLFLSPQQILQLSDEAASKITWIVWGHDLYTVKKTDRKTARDFARDTIHSIKRIIRGTYIREWKVRKAIRKKVSLFRSIGIGFPYDEVAIRKKYGRKVPVVFGPVMGSKSEIPIKQLREGRLKKQSARQKSEPIRILVGHSGYDFIEHEKYLRKLSAYKDENIHVYMVLCYGANEEKIKYLTQLAVGLFGQEKVTVQTEMLPATDYYSFLSMIDIAIFPFLHQSALGNTKRMAYMGTKLYFDPRGVLAKGFLAGGVRTFDCKKIGLISFSEFCKMPTPPSGNERLFQSYGKNLGIPAWKRILE